MSQSQGLQSDFIRETEIKSFMIENIIGERNQNQVISKKLIQMILPNERQPKKILEQQNQLIKYIKINVKNYIKEFISIYQATSQFKLTKYGQYCAEDNERYIVFSEFMVSFICILNKKWYGFCYHQENSAYVGQFSNMLSNGYGKGLFQFQHSHPSKNTKKIVYHQFQGIWQNGEIKTGTRKSFLSYGNPPFLQYKGNFYNFSFHSDKGILKTHNKTLEGKFQKGVFINNENLGGTVVPDTAALAPVVTQVIKMGNP